MCPHLQVSVTAAGRVAGPTPVEAAAAEFGSQGAGQLLQGQISRTCKEHKHAHQVCVGCWTMLSAPSGTGEYQQLSADTHTHTANQLLQVKQTVLQQQHH
jgi:hypothetical protein